jgi:transcriptional regulator with XRE-family HTH domain
MRPEPVTQWGPDNTPGDPTVMALGDRIKTLRTEAGWSQAELGERVHTDSQRISRYENGRITPSLDALIRLAEALDVSCDYLLIDGAPRRPLSTGDAAIAERISQLATLDTADRDAVLHILDGLIAKNRVRDALHEAS